MGFIPLVHDLALISHSQSIVNSGVSDFVVKPRLVHKYPAVSSPGFLRWGRWVSLAYHYVSCASDLVFVLSEWCLPFTAISIPLFGHHFKNSFCLMPIPGFTQRPSGSAEMGLGRALGCRAVPYSGGRWCSKGPVSSWECQNVWSAPGSGVSPSKWAWGSLKSSSISGGWFWPEKRCGFLTIRVLLNSTCGTVLWLG